MDDFTPPSPTPLTPATPPAAPHDDAPGLAGEGDTSPDTSPDASDASDATEGSGSPSAAREGEPGEGAFPEIADPNRAIRDWFGGLPSYPASRPIHPVIDALMIAAWQRCHLDYRSFCAETVRRRAEDHVPVLRSLACDGATITTWGGIVYFLRENYLAQTEAKPIEYVEEDENGHEQDFLIEPPPRAFDVLVPAGDGGVGGVRVFLSRGELLQGTSRYPHAHVSTDGGVCFGDAVEDYSLTIRDRQWDEAMDLVLKVLDHPSGEEPYDHPGRIYGTACRRCGRDIDLNYPTVIVAAIGPYADKSPSDPARSGCTRCTQQIERPSHFPVAADRFGAIGDYELTVFCGDIVWAARSGGGGTSPHPVWDLIPCEITGRLMLPGQEAKVNGVVVDPRTVALDHGGVPYDTTTPRHGPAVEDLEEVTINDVRYPNNRSLMEQIPDYLPEAKPVVYYHDPDALLNIPLDEREKYVFVRRDYAEHLAEVLAAEEAEEAEEAEGAGGAEAA